MLFFRDKNSIVLYFSIYVQSRERDTHKTKEINFKVMRSPLFLSYKMQLKAISFAHKKKQKTASE